MDHHIKYLCYLPDRLGMMHMFMKHQKRYVDKVESHKPGVVHRLSHC